MRILIVEDEEHLAVGLKFNFEQEGYQVDVAGDGPKALKLLGEADPPIDLVILDLMLPGMSGYEICTAIRKTDELVPILTLTAKDTAADRAHAFDCGTDQYLAKPFDLQELLARVRNLLRKRKTTPSPVVKSVGPGGTFSFDDVTIDFAKFEVRQGSKPATLTTLEAGLLRLLVENEGRVLSRGEILDQVWGISSDVTTRTVDNFVMRLRKLIEKDPTRPQHLLSVRGTGYRFVAKPEVATDVP